MRQYTTEDMVRDLTPVVLLAVGLVVVLGALLAIEAAATGASVWDCAVKPACGTMG